MQAKSRAADEIWAKFSEKDAPSYTHPSREQVELLRKSNNTLLLPECASFRTRTGDFFHVDFRIGVQIVNRGKTIDADVDAATWQAVVQDRQERCKPKLPQDKIIELLQEVVSLLTWLQYRYYLLTT